ncbi:Nucleotide-diphospho-sugar transferase [Seminavis robusta]|uniref:Nucleotide-diphospho-sugar transferase n=1 Tax=Seminavis robusta TaxID=568900 RepID=A0A9N8E578_9STRA|nr:Nucleotide-diphospho-sugar transferase [Seminavis robusta]|eukprot:Sro672_g185090.1 Nucleotide-diphospho-sugar transferase (636) ;mRNA; f:32405-34793
MPSPLRPPATPPRSQGLPSTSWSSCTPKFLVLQAMLCGTCLSLGFRLGVNFQLHGCSPSHKEDAMNSPPILSERISNEECNAKFQPIVAHREQSLQRFQAEYRKLQRLHNETVAATPGSNTNTNTANSKYRFEKEVDDFAEGMTYIPRDEFNSRFDVGVPLDPSTKFNDKVLLLYSDSKSLPSDPQAKEAARRSGDIPTLGVFRAVHNCDFLNVVFLQPARQKQCTAIVGQYASYHISKYMRLPDNDKGGYGPLDSSVPLQLVNRGAQLSGRKSTRVPAPKDTQKYWKTLKTYLDTLPSVLEELKPIAAKVAKENTVVVMLANHGQSELLMNFVCNARSRNLDISSVLVFATDQETKDLAEGMGLTVFYDVTNYGKSPKGAARTYGDGAFTAMMFAKVYCVQMVASLGYDVLFQDLDVVWFRSPLEYFHDKNSPSHGFDIYFQDDGNRAVFYAPYSANSGFYYVRSNEVTQYFFNSLLMSGDLIYTSHSHQIALIAILSEFASRYGMKVKVLSKDTDEFPGGHAFHAPNRKDFLKDMFAGKVKPYIFHMSWTENKDNKKLYYRQIGEWFVHDKCIGATANDILRQEVAGNVEKGSLVAPCCAAEAIFSCHYIDKPSKEPCPDAPYIDPNKGVPFW